MYEIKLHPMLSTELQNSMFNNGLPCVHAIHMHQSTFLNELPPITPDYFGSKFQYLISIHSGQMYDLCGMLYSTFLTSNNQYKQLDQEANILNKMLADQSDAISDEEHETQGISLSRARERINSIDMHLEQITVIASQGFTVQLWAFNEKLMSKLLKLFSTETGIDFTIPYQWDKVNETLNDLNINLNSLTKAISSYNELRVLNNKIKHLGEVDSTLAQYSGFLGQEGKIIDDLPLELQRYLDCSFAVLTYVAEQLALRARDSALRQQLLSKSKYKEVTI